MESTATLRNKINRQLTMFLILSETSW